MAERAAVAIMAKAPEPGTAKTRLIPALGAAGAAALQERLIRRAVATATDAALGRVSLWCAPDASHPLLRAMRTRYGATLHRQPGGDLGERMHAAAVAANGPVLIVGTDCPAIDVNRLHLAAATLRNYDVVIIPAEDGGYVLIGLRQPPPAALFADMAWSTDTVMSETRKRLRSLTLTWRELPTLWDIDRPQDLERLRREGFGELLQ
jgi:rSAM/selenodomain-associated transferase 1